jgi:SAM-dependent methyltransferase
MVKVKPDTHIVFRGQLGFIMESEHQLRRFKPWLGDAFSFIYDRVMTNSVFPKKFGADVGRHYEILSSELADMRDKPTLEVGTGTGSAVHFLDPSNQYAGVDVSPGLLRQAAAHFKAAGFREPELYVASGDDLPFADATFDLCLCILSLNFIGNTEGAIEEIRRVLTPRGHFVCSVPVPERNRQGSTIHGVLHSETELEKICNDHGLSFDPIPRENGALLYFMATKAQ